MTEYEVWALGYNKDCDPIDVAILLGVFNDVEQAVQYSKKFRVVADVAEQEAPDKPVRIKNFYPDEGNYLNLVVEAVTDDDVTVCLSKRLFMEPRENYLGD